MTAIVTRSPLDPLDMSASQRPTRRRSAKHAFEDAEAPPAKRTRTDTNAMGHATGRQANGKANGAKSKPTKTAYDEDDDGFQFSRTRSKKAQTKTTAPQSADANSKPTVTAPTRRRKGINLAPTPSDDEAAPERRRSARLSGDRTQLGTVPSKPKRPKQTEDRKAPTKIAHSPEPELGELQLEKKHGGTKIALPFADTPVIRRNKEMRKGSGQGHRRSSTGMRGRRASSLIDSGASNGREPRTSIPSSASVQGPGADLNDNTALPHADVGVADFYKHIEQSLPEPRRMKQLLTWCGTRALPEKPTGGTGDTSVILAADAARHIQEELLKDFANKSEMSDWFNREDTAPTVLVKKPNPRNTQMAAKLQELEEHIKRLQDEKRSWEDLLCSSGNSLDPATTKLPDPDVKPEPMATGPILTIDSAILDDSSQAAILAALLPQSSAASATASSEALQSRLRHMTAMLEPQIDCFADGVHRVGQYRLAAERVADRILGAAANRLEQRDRAMRAQGGTEGIGVDDALRVLGGILGSGDK